MLPVKLRLASAVQPAQPWQGRPLAQQPVWQAEPPGWLKAPAPAWLEVWARQPVLRSARGQDWRKVEQQPEWLAQRLVWLVVRWAAHWLPVAHLPQRRQAEQPEACWEAPVLQPEQPQPVELLPVARRLELAVWLAERSAPEPHRLALPAQPPEACLGV